MNGENCVRYSDLTFMQHYRKAWSNPNYSSRETLILQVSKRKKLISKSCLHQQPISFKSTLNFLSFQHHLHFISFLPRIQKVLINLQNQIKLNPLCPVLTNSLGNGQYLLLKGHSKLPCWSLQICLIFQTTRVRQLIHSR